MQCPLFVSWGPVCLVMSTGDDELGWLVGRVYLFLGGNSVWLLLVVGVTSLVWIILWKKDGRREGASY